MVNPRFSIVIPTRERPETLFYALCTCLAQRFDDYEVVVCDNCSSPKTKETVESFKSEKIKYIRSDRPLAMSQNWELAVSHAEGEYVIIIGDDDGLMLNALCNIDQLLKALDVKILHWKYIYYKWPNYPAANKNQLTIPLITENRILQSSDVIPKVANYKISYELLPQIYYSAIHRDIITLLRKKTGRIFGASSPDVYSGFAFAYLAQNYAYVGLPMCIAGQSASSNGFACLCSKDSPIAQEFNVLNAEMHLNCHPLVPDILVLPAVVADSFQHAKDALFPGEKIYINRKRLVLNCLTQLRERYVKGMDSEEDWRLNLAKIEDSLKDDARLLTWFNKKFRNASVDDINIGWFDLLRQFDSKFLTRLSNNSHCFEGFEKGFNGKDLVLDASEFGLKNVFDVAEFCEKFYNTNINIQEWHGQGIKPELMIMVKRMRLIIARKIYNLR